MFKAVHKPTELTVAFKRVRYDGPDQLARMKREVSIGQQLRSNRHVMPVLDASEKGDWMVMPFAPGNVEAFRARLTDDSDRLLHVAEAASELRADVALEEASDALFAWDGSWDQWHPQPAIRRWLVAGPLRRRGSSRCFCSASAPPFRGALLGSGRQPTR